MRFRQKWQCVFLAIMMLLMIIAAGCSAPSGGSNDRNQQAGAQQLKVQVLDIGQGDAILIKTSQEVVLIDTGDIGTRDKLVNYLKSQGITTIDKVFITHPHADHLGGMPGILNSFTVKQIYDSGISTTTSLYRQYLTAVQKKNIPFSVVSPGTQLDIGGGVMLKILAPEKPAITNSELNNNSIVMKLSYGRFSMLFPGDAEKEEEGRLLKDYASELRSTVLKAGHHGSNTSSTLEFLKAIAPEAVIISVGQNNDYHHPHPSTVKKYADIKAKVYRTDMDGTVTITSDGQNFNIAKEK